MFLSQLISMMNWIRDVGISTAAKTPSLVGSAMWPSREMERQFAQRSEAEPDFHEGAYIFGDEKRHYCTGCYDTKGKKVLMNEVTGPFTVFGKWECPACDKKFGPSSG